MKKITSIVIILLLIVNSGFSQYSILGTNEPTGGSEKYGPYYRAFINSNLNYSRYAYLYTKDELDMRPGSKIKTIEWLKSINFTLTGSNQFRIWLRNTDVTDIGYNDTWGNISSGASLVFQDNNRSFSAQNNQFESFVLTDTFTYTGSSLLILTDHVKGGTATGPNRFYYTGGFKKSIGIASSSSLSSASVLDTSYGAFRPTIRIQYDDPILSQFSVQSYMGGFSQPVGFTNDQAGNKYVWEKGGKVWIINTFNVKLPNPLIDLSEEVGNWGDHGLVGFVLDPSFSMNGYFYLAYTVDRHHLLHFGTPQYNSTSNEYWNATIGRVVRYQADINTNFTSVVPGSRMVLIGENKRSGIPITYLTHGLNTLMFGNDGSLLISTGDGSSYQEVDTGNSLNAYYVTALMDSILAPYENVGAFRSQLVQSLNGKILRINPQNGDGLPGNPFYNSSAPRAAESRVFSLGLRNPYRMTIKPNTGSTNIFVGDPGVIFVGDVGWSSWEELNRLESKGQNFGWPIFEGLTLDSNYSINNCPHPFANNPLFGIGNCTQSNFYFRELLKEDTLNNPFYSNSCNIVEAIPAYIPKFIHARPLIDWRHYAPPITRVPSFDNGSAKAIGITDMSSPCKGMAFNGNASVPGLWYEKNGFPNEFKEAYYFADYVGGWIRYLKFDSNNNLFEVNHFADTLGLIVYVGESNLDDCIYFIKYPNEIKKICFTGNYNDPPIAKASANIIYGPTPLSVSLDGSGSYDSDGLIVSYYWDFGDGNTSNSISPAHTFIATVGVPTVYKVELTVVDNLGQQSSDSIFVYVNNSPPQINIISFNDGDLYSIVQSSLLNLQAIVTDAEHGPNDLFYTWNTMLHRNSHSYNWDTDTNKLSSVILNPLGCGFDVYRYSISLAVKDVLGLESRVIQNVYPNCLGLNVLDIEYENDLVLYPNPIQDDKVYIKGNFNPKTVTLLDMSGRVAYTSTEIYKLESQLYFFTFNKQSFKSGIYLLQFITTDNKILTKKLVVF